MIDSIILSEFLMEFLMLLFVSLFVFCAILYAFPRDFSSDNFFLRESSEDSQEIMDLNEEDLIRNTSFFPKRKFVLLNQYDVIIIGSGISALTAASILSQERVKVLVLEQCDSLGGFCRTWMKGDIEYPTGLHYLFGVLSEGNPFKLLFDRLCEGRVKFRSFSPIFDTLYINDTMVEISDTLYEDLLRTYPAEKKAIEKWFNLAERIYYQELPTIFLLRNIRCKVIRRCIQFVLSYFYEYKGFMLNEMNIDDTLDYVGIKDSTLRASLSYMFSVMGKREEVTGLHLMFIFAGFFCKIKLGKSLPRGGPSIFIKKIVKTIVKHGGVCCTNARVTQILVRSNSCYGVKLANGDELYASNVISTVGLRNSCELLDIPLSKRQLDIIGESSHHFFVFIAAKGNLRALRMPDSDVLIFDESITGGLLYINNPNYAVPIKTHSVFTILCRCDPPEFERWKNTVPNHRGNDYAEWKEKKTDKLLSIVFKRFPKLQEELIECTSASPLSTKFWTGWKGGESYGAKCGSNRLFTINDAVGNKVKSVKGFHFAGMDSFFGPGVQNSCMTGVSVCCDIMKKDYLKELDYANGLILGKIRERFLRRRLNKSY